MAPRLQILSNVIERLKNLKGNASGHVYGVMNNNTLTVLTFSLNVSNSTEQAIDHNILQLNMPAEVYLCGVLHIGEGEQNIPDMFQDIDITDNPIFLKYSHNDSKIQSYFYIHHKLETIDHAQIVTEDDIYQEFIYIRLRGSLPLIAQNNNVVELLEDLRKNIALGKIGIHFPVHNIYLLNNDHTAQFETLKELLNVCETQEVSAKTKRNLLQCAGIMECINVNMLLKISGDNVSDERITYAPVLQHVRRSFNSLKCKLNIDALSLVNHNVNSGELYGILVESVCRNIKLIENYLEKQFHEINSSTKLPRVIHFKPGVCGHSLTAIYPNSNDDNITMEYRKSLHKVLGLDLIRPYFRYANALKFFSDLRDSDLLINPHLAIAQSENSTKSFRKIGTVQGLYAYHHYMQDNFNDNGWGCAYRSLQTIISWYRFQGYSSEPIPSHHIIQKCLVDIRDKPSNFINSKQWIGSTEVGFVLQTLLGINVRILYASTGEEMSSLATDLLHHFHTQGTPVMIGGGVLAHTILGVSYDEDSEEVKFLILDPHYTGPEHLPTIISKGFCGWKTNDFWKKDAFYNMCLPQRPVCY